MWRVIAGPWSIHEVDHRSKAMADIGRVHGAAIHIYRQPSSSMKSLSHISKNEKNKETKKIPHHISLPSTGLKLI